MSCRLVNGLVYLQLALGRRSTSVSSVGIPVGNTSVKRKTVGFHCIASAFSIFTPARKIRRVLLTFGAHRIVFKVSVFDHIVSSIYGNTAFFQHVIDLLLVIDMSQLLVCKVC